MASRYYTQLLARARDPNNGVGRLDLWVVWDMAEATGPRQVAYCPREEDAQVFCAELNVAESQLPRE